MTAGLVVLAFVCILFALGLLAYQVALTPSAGRPTLGVRGAKRSSALASPWFRYVEPTLCRVAGCVSRLPLGRVRKRLESWIRAAGEVIGLSPDELVAVCAVCGAAAYGVGLAVERAFPMRFLPALLAVFGSTIPLLWLRSVARRRLRRIESELPAAVELAALCMGAGLDFPGALTHVTSCSISAEDPLVEELEQVLQEIRFGHTRERALRRLADRVPSDAVSQFCSSVIQAERKGAPVARALVVQAQTLRLRRSIVAEERASGAAVRLVGPMALVFLSVILLVIAPLIVRFASGEFRLQ